MSKVKMEIWGREFNLEVFYKNYKGKERKRPYRA